MNEILLAKLIDQRIRNLGLTENEANIDAFCIKVVSANQIEPLGQNTIVLVNRDLDIPQTAQLIIDSGNNKLETSKQEYEKNRYSGYQFFDDRITITTSNYGLLFTPYQLEFIRISPNKQPITQQTT